MRRALFLSLSPPEVARSVFYKKDHEKKMTHMLKKIKMTHMEGKEKALVLSGAGAHILAPPGETVPALSVHRPPPGGKEDKAPTVWGAAVTMETEKEHWVSGTWRAPAHHCCPLCSGTRLHHSPCSCAYTPGLLCGR